MFPTNHDDPYPVPRRPAPEPQPGRGLFYALLVLIGLGVGVLGFWLGGVLIHRLNPPPRNNPEAAPREAAPNGPLDGEEAEANNLFEACKDSVVNVDTVVRSRDTALDQVREQQAGTGSGFMWDTDGRIVTNYHVVEEYDHAAQLAQQRGVANPVKLRVVLADRSHYDAVLVGTDPSYDLAVIQIPTAPKEKFKPLDLARSNDLKVGQKAFAIGNPFGLSLTMTKGIISNVGRAIRSPTGSPIPDVIQHSAAINPGNSGGPLLNRFGKLIGVNTAIPETRGGGNVGIGFAIPSDTVNEVVTNLVRTGRSPRPDLGVELYDESAVRAAGYHHGVMIGKVAPGGPADQAGLKGVQPVPGTRRYRPGDLILTINGAEVDDVDSYRQAVAKLHPGETATLKILRVERTGEREMTVTVTVGGV